MAQLPIRRQRQGKTFRYNYGDGRPLTDKDTLERVAHLAIPPAWREVHIAASPRAKLQATGVDDAGRTQYLYNPEFRARQEAAKFDRIVQFGRKLPLLRRCVAKDLRRKRLDKRKVAACALQLMDEAYFRVGNQQYASEHGSYGVTTLRSKHLDISGDTVTFDFTGKSNQHQHKRLKNRTLVRILKQLDETPGYELFRYYDAVGQLHNLTSSDINEYIKDVMGSDFSAKDFRTWGGTLKMCLELANIERPAAARERKKAVSGCVKKVARLLGNTPAVTRSSYIDPRVLELYEASDKLVNAFKTVKSAEASAYVPAAERCALQVLTKG